MRPSRAALCATVLLSGCTDPVGPEVWERFEPPPEYALWHRDVQACSGLSGSFDRIEWRLVPGGRWYSELVEREIGGQWVGPHTIYVAEELALDRTLVAHEMLHDLLGRPGHPSPPYGRCEVE